MKPDGSPPRADGPGEPGEQGELGKQGELGELEELGEFGLIDAVAARFPPSPHEIVGIGDDSAVLAAPDGNVVAAVDFLLEGRHFRRAWSSGFDVGVKAAARSLADIAAMGAVPTTLLVALALPGSLPASWALDFASGVAAECERAGAGVAGGDTARAEQVIVSVTALGSLPPGVPAVRRAGARPGDVVAVCGPLGHAAAGLALLEAGAGGLVGRALPEAGAGSVPGRASRGEGGLPGRGSPEGGAGAGGLPGRATAEPGEGGLPWRATAERDVGGLPGRGSQGAGDLPGLVAAHLRPSPPYAAGLAAARLGATAMIDTSDGLLADLGHIADASAVAIDVSVSLLGMPESLASAARLLISLEAGQVPPGEASTPAPAGSRRSPLERALEWALTGGEDHSLAAAFPPAVALPEDWRVIGMVRAGRGVTVDGAPHAGPGGWQHFR